MSWEGGADRRGNGAFSCRCGVLVDGSGAVVSDVGALGCRVGAFIDVDGALKRGMEFIGVYRNTQ